MAPLALHWVQRQTHSGNFSLVRDTPAISKKKERKKKGKEKRKYYSFDDTAEPFLLF